MARSWGDDMFAGFTPLTPEKARKLKLDEARRGLDDIKYNTGLTNADLRAILKGDE